MRKAFYFFALILFVAPSAAAQAKPHKTGAAVRAVKQFYRFHYGHDREISAARLRRMRPFITTALNQFFLDELQKREKVLRECGSCKTQFENYGFELLPDGCPLRYGIGKGAARGAIAATVTVNFYGTKRCPETAGELISSFQIKLVKVGGKWLIDSRLE